MAKSFLGPAYTDNIAAALKREAARAEPEYRRTGWISWLADTIGAADTTVKNWVYAVNPPPGDALLMLFAILGDDFTNDVLSLIGHRAVPLGSGEIDSARVYAKASRIRELAEDIAGEMETAIENGADEKDAA